MNWAVFLHLTTVRGVHDRHVISKPTEDEAKAWIVRNIPEKARGEYRVERVAE